VGYGDDPPEQPDRNRACRGSNGEDPGPPSDRRPRGISTSDFQEALTLLAGEDPPNVVPAVISRSTTEWQGKYEQWSLVEVESCLPNKVAHDRL
jgi:hypothetical protein